MKEITEQAAVMRRNLLLAPVVCWPKILTIRFKKYIDLELHIATRDIAYPAEPETTNFFF